MDADRDIDDVIEDIASIIMAEPSCAAISARAFVNSVDKNVKEGSSLEDAAAEIKKSGEPNGKHSLDPQSSNLNSNLKYYFISFIYKENGGLTVGRFKIFNFIKYYSIITLIDIVLGYYMNSENLT